MSTAGNLWARGRFYVDRRFPRLRRRLPPLLMGLLGAVAVRSARALMLLQEPRRSVAVRASRRPEPGFDPDEG